MGNMNRLKLAAEELQIKHLTAGICVAENQFIFPEESAVEYSMASDNDDAKHEYISSIADEFIKFDIPANTHGSEELLEPGKQFKCEECEATYTSNISLLRHRRKHEGTVHYCQQCNYKSTRKDNLRSHKKSVHDGVKYLCDQCDYMSGNKSNLRIHQKSIHEGVKYSCNQCDYQATQQVHLKTHKLNAHEGVQYFCNS